MAYKRKHKRKSHHRRRSRRMSGVKALVPAITDAAAVGAGAVAAAFANAAAKKALPATTLTKYPWLTGIIIAAAGVALPKFVRNPMVQDASKGMIAAGLLFAVNESFLSLPGISGVGVTPGYRYTPKLQKSVGAPGFMDKPIAGMSNRDLAAVGAMYDN